MGARVEAGKAHEGAGGKVTRRGLLTRIFGAAIAPLASKVVPRHTPLSPSLAFDYQLGDCLAIFRLHEKYIRAAEVQIANQIDKDLEFYQGDQWTPEQMRVRFDPKRLPA